MTARNFALGIDCALYYVPSAFRASIPDQSTITTIDDFTAGLWTLIEPIRDVTLNLTGAVWDATTRASNRWRQNVQTLLEGSLDFQVLWLPDNAVFSELLARFLDGCPVALMALDAQFDFTAGKPVATRCGDNAYVVTGLWADWTVTSFSRSEPLEEGSVADVTIQPALGLIYPDWLQYTPAGVTTTPAP